MRNQIIVKMMATIFLMVAAFGVNAQNTSSDKFNYVVLTRKIPQLSPIILAAQNLAEQDQEKFGEFHVVICGKATKHLTNQNKVGQYIDMAKSTGVKLFACGFSLQKFNVDADALPDQIKVVKNGILYGFKLQKQGYMSIDL